MSTKVQTLLAQATSAVFAVQTEIFAVKRTTNASTFVVNVGFVVSFGDRSDSVSPRYSRQPMSHSMGFAEKIITVATAN